MTEGKKEEKPEKMKEEKVKKEILEEKLEKKPEEKFEKLEEREVEKVKEKPEKEVKVSEKIKKLVEEIEKMSVLDLAELVKILEKKFGVSAQAPVAAPTPAPTAPPAAAAPAEEKTVFNIVLKEVGDKKIEVIKAVRDIAQKGLKEAKDLVDAVASGPQVIKENVKKEEAEEIKKKLEAAGAKVELK